MIPFFGEIVALRDAPISEHESDPPMESGTAASVANIRSSVQPSRPYNPGAWQEQYFAEHFDPAPIRIVVVDGRDAGVIAVVSDEADTLLANIEILPEYQGCGLGAALVRHVVAEAETRDLPVRLQVLRSTPPGDSMNGWVSSSLARPRRTT